MDSAALLGRFRASGGQAYQAPLFAPYLSLNKPYADLLAKLGNPQDHLPPVIHVGGTNGKGSTSAFLRAMIEAAGKKVHVYTSPHLVSWNERIRIAGKLISEDELSMTLSQIASLCDISQVSHFEALTAAALSVFTQHKAHAVILEVGLGGRLDATNIVKKPVATVISRLSYDHRDYLGDTMAQIAREKAAIMRPGIPCFSAPQPDADALQTLKEVAKDIDAPLLIGNENWDIEPTADGFTYTGPAGRVTLQNPALLGEHQYWNAGLAITVSQALPFIIDETAIRRAMITVSWPARLQHLTNGSLANLLPVGSELWLDGGHNDSAGEVLAKQLAKWRAEKPDMPLYMITGMLSTKKPSEFLGPLATYVDDFRGVSIPNEALSLPAMTITASAQSLGIVAACAANSVREAIVSFIQTNPKPARYLICGSLYLAGSVLAENNQDETALTQQTV